MKYLICLILLPAVIFGQTYDYHLEHKRMLIIESQLLSIRHIVEENYDNLPLLDYAELIYRISILESILD